MSKLWKRDLIPCKWSVHLSSSSVFQRFPFKPQNGANSNLSPWETKNNNLCPYIPLLLTLVCRSFPFFFSFLSMFCLTLFCVDSCLRLWIPFSLTLFQQATQSVYTHTVYTYIIWEGGGRGDYRVKGSKQWLTSTKRCAIYFSRPFVRGGIYRRGRGFDQSPVLWSVVRDGRPATRPMNFFVASAVRTKEAEKLFSHTYVYKGHPRKTVELFSNQRPIWSLHNKSK